MVLTASLFNQLLHHFPRTEFGALVKATKAERHARGFTSWAQFVAMLFCQLAQADSLRLICNGLTCCLGKLKHLGISEAPTKSSLAYANRIRPAALFQQLFWKTIERFRSQSMLGPSSKPFRCVCRCFHGRSLRKSKVASRRTCFWITMTICPDSFTSPVRFIAMSKLPIKCLFSGRRLS